MENLKSSKNKVIGYKQALKAVKSGKAEKLYIAEDIEERIKNTIMEACQEGNCEIVYVGTMKELGNMCGIEVGASTVAILTE